MACRSQKQNEKEKKNGIPCFLFLFYDGKKTHIWDKKCLIALTNEAV